MHDPFIPVIQLDLGFVIIGGVALVLMAFNGGAAFDSGIVGMIRDIDSAESVRRNVLFQPVIGTEAAFQHLLVFLKALFPGNHERNDLLRRVILRFLLLQHHGGTAVAAECRCRCVEGVNSRTAGRTGQQFHPEASARVPGFLFIRFSNAHLPVAPAALQLLARNIKQHLGSAPGTTVHACSSCKLISACS